MRNFENDRVVLDIIGRPNRRTDVEMPFRKAMSRRKLIGGGLALVGGMALGIDLFPKNARAQALFQYDGMAAANYADKWAISNGGYPSQGGDKESRGDDCTNFASNAMFAGGFPMDDQWYSYGNWFGWQYSSAWVNADYLFDYLYKTGYGQFTHGYQGYQRGITNTNGLQPGDLIFFSWKNNGYINHMAIQTTGGVDQWGSPYDEVDAHTDNRLHVFWTLEDFWEQASRATIPDPNNVAVYTVHIVTNTATNIYIPTY